MTKEAKVGMLTGLGVIVVIGVLLSEYLNTPPGVAPSSLATGKMAALPMGEAKRTQMLQEVGVPAMVQAESTAVSGGGGGLQGIPTAFAADVHRDAPLAAVPVSAGPVVGAPVSAVPAGPVQVASVQGLEAPATVQVEETTFQPGAPVGAADGGAAMASDGVAKPVQVQVAGEEYTIAKGDGLGKIATKFYKANTAENRERIVAANPSLMKDGQVFLMAGKKIVIPAAPTAARMAAAPAAKPASTTVKVDPKKTPEPAVVIGLPGTKTTQNKAADVKVASAGASPVKTDGTKADPAKKTDTKVDLKKVEAKVYVVKGGDSLEKIARRLDSENYQSAMKKIIAANGIKNASSLQVGDKLKLPM
jgi:nucleoid-associated protein YgaU